jgi:hypothetical protein
MALDFHDLYRMPVGPMGLEPSDKLLALNGQRVRMTGFMVDYDGPLPGAFMFSPLPVNLSEEEEGQADDLPASAVFVHLPAEYAAKAVPFHPGPVEIVGRLELGAHDEANGRRSFVRVYAEVPTAATGDALTRAAAPALHGIRTIPARHTQESRP